MLLFIEIKIRNLILHLLTSAIRFITLLPSLSIRDILIAKLISFKKKFILNLFVDYSFLSYVKKKQNGLEKNFNEIKTLALRGSTADYEFYSPIWSESYNIGLTSTDLYTCYHLYNNYRNSLPNLKNIIVFAAVFLPGYSLLNTIERYRAVAYKHFFNVPYSNAELISPKYEKWILKKCRNIKLTEIEPDYRGYDKKIYYGIKIVAQDRVRTHLRENNREPNQLKWLKSLAELIKKDNRKLFIVIPPFRSDYKALLPSDSILFEKLFNLKIEGIQFLNFLNSEIFGDNDFGDTEHLNEQGAIKLTNEIYEIFKKNNYL